MQILYKTSAVSTGGRDGKVVVENSPLEFDMALAPELGGKKTAGVNPEQLFAAGYSACYGSALDFVMAGKKIDAPVPTVHTTIGIGSDGADGLGLDARILVVFKGVDQQTADALANEAHQVCPYSKATRGNINVAISAKVE